MVMDLKEKIKTYLAQQGINLSEAEVKLAEAVLEDGTKVFCDADEFVVGGNIYLLNEEQEQIPLPAGEYTLEDGRVFVVEEEGVLAAIQEAPQPEAEAEEEVAEVAEEDLSKEVVEYVDQQLSAVKAQFAADLELIGAEHEEVVAKLQKELQEKVNEVEALKLSAQQLPKGEPVREAVQPLDLAKMTVKQRVAALTNNKNK